MAENSRNVKNRYQRAICRALSVANRLLANPLQYQLQAKFCFEQRLAHACALRLIEIESLSIIAAVYVDDIWFSLSCHMKNHAP